MKIGKLSKATGISIATIRLYEWEGLIGPASRTEGRLRQFTREQEQRLDFIKRVRNLGFPLNDVKALLGLSGPTEEATIHELIERIRHGVTERKHDLARLEKCLRQAGDDPVSILDLYTAF